MGGKLLGSLIFLKIQFLKILVGNFNYTQFIIKKKNYKC